MDPYLRRPEYSNIMNASLRTRLAYDQNARARRSSSGAGKVTNLPPTRGSRGYDPNATDTAAPGSPQSRMDYRNSMMVEKAKELELEKIKIGNENLMMDQKLKVEKQASDIKTAEKAGARADKVIEATRFKNVADSMGTWASVSTQANASEMFDTLAEEAQISRNSFPSLTEIESWSPVEFEKKKSQWAEGSAYSKNTRLIKEANVKFMKEETKRLEDEAKKIAADKKAVLKAETDAKKGKEAAHKEYLSLEKAIAKMEATGGVSDIVYAMADAETKAKMDANKNVSGYTAVARERQRQLKEAHGLDTMPKITKADVKRFMEAAAGDAAAAKQMAINEGFEL